MDTEMMENKYDWSVWGFCVEEIGNRKVGR